MIPTLPSGMSAFTTLLFGLWLEVWLWTCDCSNAKPGEPSGMTERNILILDRREGDARKSHSLPKMLPSDAVADPKHVPQYRSLRNLPFLILFTSKLWNKVRSTDFIALGKKYKMYVYMHPGPQSTKSDMAQFQPQVQYIPSSHKDNNKWPRRW